MKIHVAFYKSNHDKAKFMDKIISLTTNSMYSHVELVFDIAIDKFSGYCYSSSPRDGGVRSKLIEFNPTRWDLVEVDTDKTEDELYKFMSDHIGKKYDWLGAVGVVVPWFNGKEHRWFCSEIVAEFLGLSNPPRVSPGTLYSLLHAPHVACAKS